MNIYTYRTVSYLDIGVSSSGGCGGCGGKEEGMKEGRKGVSVY